MGNNLSLAEIEIALKGLSGADWKRIKIMASRYANGLVFLSPEDLISETYTALFSGERSFPRNVAPVIVVINAMHSEASNCREREREGAIDHRIDVETFKQPIDCEDDNGPAVVPSTDLTPEHIVSSRELLNAVHEAIVEDAELQEVAVAWSMGIRGQEAAEFLGWEMNMYEAARKRLVRRLDAINKEMA